MRLNLQHLGLRSRDSVDSWVEGHVLALGEIRRIDEATVRLARLAGASPAYRVNVHLVTPGPDLFVECRDHTLRAAFSKAVRQLRSRLDGRVGRRARKHDSVRRVSAGRAGCTAVS